MKRILIILAVLLVLPWALKVRGDVSLDTADVWRWMEFTSDIDSIPDSILRQPIITNPGDFEDYRWNVDSVTLDHDNDGLVVSPTYVVIRVDTVGWEVYQRDSINIWCDWDSVPTDLRAFECYRIELLRRPILATTIIGSFTTDADPKEITKWRVRSK